MSAPATDEPTPVPISLSTCSLEESGQRATGLCGLTIIQRERGTGKLRGQAVVCKTKSCLGCGNSWIERQVRAISKVFPESLDAPVAVARLEKWGDTERKALARAGSEYVRIPVGLAGESVVIGSEDAIPHRYSPHLVSTGEARRMIRDVLEDHRQGAVERRRAGLGARNVSFGKGWSPARPCTGEMSGTLVVEEDIATENGTEATPAVEAWERFGVAGCQGTRLSAQRMLALALMLGARGRSNRRHFIVDFSKCAAGTEAQWLSEIGFKTIHELDVLDGDATVHNTPRSEVRRYYHALEVAARYAA